MKKTLLFLLGNPIIIVVLLLFGWAAIDICRPHGPQVIVNMPANAKALQALPHPAGDAKIISGDRAILWWTVYSAALEHHRDYPADDARRAIEACYGSTP